MKWIGTQTIYDHVRLNKGITLDSVSITTIQSSGESFVDNDTSLMTSAAVDDRINTAVTAEDLDLTADSGTAAVDLNSQALAVTGGTNATTSATGQAVTINVDDAFIKNDADDATSGTITSKGLIVGGSKSVTPGDGAMIHVDTSTITDSNTSGSGTVTKYTHVNIEGPTLAATNSSVTTTDAASLYIGSAPSAGTNQTITNAYALWVGTGNARFDGNIDLEGDMDVNGTLETDALTIDGTNVLTGSLITTVGKLAGPIEIEQGASGGGSALFIDNNDVDQVALEIGKAIDPCANTVADALKVRCDSLTTGSALKLDINDSLTASAAKTLLHIDYDKAGDTASGQTSLTKGLAIEMDDAATDNVGTITMTGLDIGIASADADGTVNQTGVNVACVNGDAATTYGYKSHVADGGTDFYARSSADAADYFSIATTANGATTLTTVDGGAAAAHFEIAADGDIILDAAGTIKLEGPVRPTGQIEMTSHGFTDDIDTTKHYIGLLEADAENTSTTNKFLPFVAPVAGKLLKVFLRANKDLSGHALTWRLETQATGVNFGTGPTIVGTQSGAGCTQLAMTTYDFTSSLDSGTNAIASDAMVYLSIQSDTDLSQTCIHYITCLWEWDYSSIG